MISLKKVSAVAAKHGMGSRSMVSIVDSLKSFFVQAHDMVPSQSMSNANQYRAKAPAAGTRDGPKPVIPETGSPDSAFKIAYYQREYCTQIYSMLMKNLTMLLPLGDTRHNVEWTYKDAEGKPLPVKCSVLIRLIYQTKLFAIW